MDCVYFCFHEQARSSFAANGSGGSVLTAISIFLGTAIGPRRNSLQVPEMVPFVSLHIPCSCSILFDGLCVCIRSMVISSLRKVITITQDSVSAWIGNCFLTQIVVCLCTLRLVSLSDSTNNILNRSLSLIKIGIAAEGISKIFLSMGKVTLMQRLMYVVQSRTLDANSRRQ